MYRIFGFILVLKVICICICIYTYKVYTAVLVISQMLSFKNALPPPIGMVSLLNAYGFFGF